MNRIGIAVTALAPLVLTPTSLAGNADIRAVHASPDTGPVDVKVNDGVAFANVPFTAVGPYASLPPDTYNLKVVPTGEDFPIAIEADPALESDTDYTVVAVGLFAEIAPLVLIDDNTLSRDFAFIRFVHASPNAPAVDIALAGGGPVLFGDIEFTEFDGYLPVEPGTYDLEVRLAGTGTVVLPIPGVQVTANRVYTAYAMGLVGGEGDQMLQAVFSVDADCPVDFNGNGNVNGGDVFSFIIALFSGEEEADYSGNGSLSIFDLLFFLGDYRVGRQDCNDIL